jgi:hypothetical protein
MFSIRTDISHALQANLSCNVGDAVFRPAKVDWTPLASGWDEPFHSRASTPYLVEGNALDAVELHLSAFAMPAPIVPSPSDIQLVYVSRIGVRPCTLARAAAMRDTRVVSLAPTTVVSATIRLGVARTPTVDAWETAGLPNMGRRKPSVFKVCGCHMPPPSLPLHTRSTRSASQTCLPTTTQLGRPWHAMTGTRCPRTKMGTLDTTQGDNTNDITWCAQPLVAGHALDC